jgi:antitoxin PrlF
VLSSKITQKFQTTVPRQVRQLLRLQAGDSVVFEIEDDKVMVRKANPIDLQFAAGLTSTLGEWGSSNDEEAYSEL